MITADNITDDQLRELLRESPDEEESASAERQRWLPLAALGDTSAAWALNISKQEARARCAEILNARKESSNAR